MSDSSTQPQTQPETQHSEAGDEMNEPVTTIETTNNNQAQKTKSELAETAKSLQLKVQARRDEAQRISEKLDSYEIRAKRDAAYERKCEYEIALADHEMKAAEQAMGDASDAEVKKTKSAMEKARKAYEEAQEAADQEEAMERGLRARLEKLEKELGNTKDGGLERDAALALLWYANRLYEEQKLKVLEAAQPLKDAVAEANAINLMCGRSEGVRTPGVLIDRVRLDGLDSFLATPDWELVERSGRIEDFNAVLSIDRNPTRARQLFDELMEGEQQGAGKK